MTLEYLEVIEAMLRKRYNDESLLLCDYFDLIGGTSTGSIIAAGLAFGLTVGQLKALYRNIGSSVFQVGWSSRLRLGGLLAPKFPAQTLQDALDRVLGADTTLDSDKIRTGLMMMTKRLDTGSPWPLHNCERARYAKQDGALHLTQIVRASTAAPTYFEPERIAISSREGAVVDGAFVDGAVSPFNDPTLQLLMLAALQGHGFRWTTGKDKLLLISVGTGKHDRRKPVGAGARLRCRRSEQARAVAAVSLMADCARVNHGILQWLTNCLTPSIIDRAVGDMRLDSQSGPQLATYARYNVLLETGLGSDPNSEFELAPDKVDCRSPRWTIRRTWTSLRSLGEAAARNQVKAEHLPAAFDLA